MPFASSLSLTPLYWPPRKFGEREASQDAAVAAYDTHFYMSQTAPGNKNHYFPSFVFGRLRDYAMFRMCGSDEVLWFSPQEESLSGENLLSSLHMLWLMLGSMAAKPLTNYVIPKDEMQRVASFSVLETKNILCRIRLWKHMPNFTVCEMEQSFYSKALK